MPSQAAGSARSTTPTKGCLRGRESVRVGENVEETLTMFPGGGGYVGPSRGSRRTGRGGGGVDMHIHLHAEVMTPGTAEAVARAVDPHVTRWQQSRGL